MIIIAYFIIGCVCAAKSAYGPIDDDGTVATYRLD